MKKTEYRMVSGRSGIKYTDYLVGKGYAFTTGKFTFVVGREWTDEYGKEHTARQWSVTEAKSGVTLSFCNGKTMQESIEKIVKNCSDERSVALMQKCIDRVGTDVNKDIYPIYQLLSVHFGK